MKQVTPESALCHGWSYVWAVTAQARTAAWCLRPVAVMLCEKSWTGPACIRCSRLFLYQAPSRLLCTGVVKKQRQELAAPRPASHALLSCYFGPTQALLGKTILQLVHPNQCCCLHLSITDQPEASGATILMVTLMQALKKRRPAGNTSMGTSSDSHHRNPCSVPAWAPAPKFWLWPLPSSCWLWLGCSIPTTEAPCFQPAWYSFHLQPL